jgi:arylsulfatase I/J
MAAAASLMITLARPTVTAAAPPNVLMILADDYGWADIGYHVNSAGYPSTAAQKKEATTATPNIDQLVKDGVELDQAYVFKFCSPTR